MSKLALAHLAQGERSFAREVYKYQSPIDQKHEVTNYIGCPSTPKLERLLGIDLLNVLGQD